MSSLQDNRGFNQGFAPSKAQSVRLERRCDRMISEMKLEPHTKILEIGCGTGELSFFLAKKTAAQVVGTDLCAQFIEMAQTTYKLPNLRFKQFKLDVGNLQRERVKYNYIVGNGILHHVFNELDQIIPCLRSRLHPGGKLLFWEPNLFNPYVFSIFKVPFLRKLAKLEPDEMAFGRGLISRQLRLAGFDMYRVCYSDFLLPNTPDRLISPLIKLGTILEKIPMIDHFSQSLFISAHLESSS